MWIGRRWHLVQPFFPGLNASLGRLLEALQVVFVEVGRLRVQRIPGVDFMETFANEEEDLPDVINIASPFGKPSADVQLVRLQIHQRMEDRVFK